MYTDHVNSSAALFARYLTATRPARIEAFKRSVKETAICIGLSPDLPELISLRHNTTQDTDMIDALARINPYDAIAWEDSTLIIDWFDGMILRPESIADFCLGEDVLKQAANMITIDQNGIHVYGGAEFKIVRFNVGSPQNVVRLVEYYTGIKLSLEDFVGIATIKLVVASGRWSQPQLTFAHN